MHISMLSRKILKMAKCEIFSLNENIWEYEIWVKKENIIGIWQEHMMKMWQECVIGLCHTNITQIWQGYIMVMFGVTGNMSRKYDRNWQEYDTVGIYQLSWEYNSVVKREVWSSWGRAWIGGARLPVDSWWWCWWLWWWWWTYYLAPLHHFYFAV